MRLMMIAAGAAALIATSAAADPWKDESGKGRDRHHYSYNNGYYGNYYGRQDGSVPNGHRPPPGECRVWIPGVPAGRQPPPTSCRNAYAQAYHYGGRVIRGGRGNDRHHEDRGHWDD